VKINRANGQTGGKNHRNAFVLTAFISFGLFNVFRPSAGYFGNGSVISYCDTQRVPDRYPLDNTIIENKFLYERISFWYPLGLTSIKEKFKKINVGTSKTKCPAHKPPKRKVPPLSRGVITIGTVAPPNALGNCWPGFDA
jgi:hypothetical protein